MKRPKVHWAKKVIYLFLKIIVRLMDVIYYERIEIINKERFKLDRPTILVSNHPSTMMDPLNVAVNVNRYVHFLANAGLFQSGFGNWFFSTFFCFPVQRKKDKGKREFDNKKSFELSYQFLADGGCLYIAAEGVSTPEHDLKPLKTGTARIALGAEAAFDNALNLQILPVGIYYSDAQRFRSKVVVVAGEPIVPAEWSAAFAKDERTASYDLTHKLQECVESLIINIDGAEQDKILRQTEAIINIKHKAPLIDQYKRTKNLADGIRKGQLAVKKKVVSIYSQIEKEQLNAETLFGKIKIKWWHLFLPLAIAGFIFNIIPLLLILGLQKAAKLYAGYTSTLRVLSGVILFPLFYRLNNFMLNKFFIIEWSVGYWSPLFWIAYLLLGLFSFYYFRSLWLGLKKINWRLFGSKSKAGMALKHSAEELSQQLTLYI